MATHSIAPIRPRGPRYASRQGRSPLHGRKVAALIALAIVMSCTGARAEAPTARYVRPDGDDSHAGSRELPLATIQHAIDLSAAGDTVMLLDGTYAGPGNRDLTFGGKNLRLASASDDPAACILDCGGSDADPHYGFWFHDNEDTTSVLRGITVTNAKVADPAFAAVMCGDGLLSYPPPGYGRAAVKLENMHVIDNDGNGIGAGGPSNFVIMSQCAVDRNQGDGLVVVTSSALQLSDCRFRDNLDNGVEMGGDGPRPGHFIRCQFSHNQGNGFRKWGHLPETRCYFSECVADSNGLSGFATEGGAYDVSLTSCAARGNGAMGLSAMMPGDGMFVTINGGLYSHNQGDGIRLDGGTPISLLATGVKSLDNGGAGLWHRNPGSFTADGVLIAGNDGPGIEIGLTYLHFQPSQCHLLRTTIARNGGEGIACQFNDLECSLALDHTLIAYNTGPAADLQGISASPLSLDCVDIYGNVGGDWEGAVAGYLGTDGNADRIPLFCGDDGSNYALQDNSPLAAANNACGTVGCYDIGCPAGTVTCRDLQDYDPGSGSYAETMLDIAVTVEGTVFVAPASYSAWGGGYLQDETGGINFWRWPPPPGLHVGDRVRITGRLWPDTGMLYVGNYTYTKLDSLQAAAPTEHSVAHLLADYGNTGSHVAVTGRVSDLTPDSFWLADGPDRIEVRRSAFAGVSFGSLSNGVICTVNSPCLKQGASLYLMPKDQAGLVVPHGWYVATDGDDGSFGTRSRPFRTIQHAVDAAAGGDTVIVFDGVYAGPGNTDITWHDRDLAIRSESGNRDACVIQCAGESGFVFTDTVVDEQHAVVLDGISIVGASTAVAVTGGVPWEGFPAPEVAVADCLIGDGDKGIRATYANLTVTGTSLRANSGAGVTVNGGLACGRTTITSCKIRDNGTGFISDGFCANLEFNWTEFVNNGRGVAYWFDSSGVSMRHCRVDSSRNGNGIRALASMQGSSLLLEDCTVSGNSGHGIVFCIEAMSGQLTATGCSVSGNGYNGIALTGIGTRMNLDDVHLVNNRRWGIADYAPDDVDFKFEVAADAQLPDKWPGYAAHIVNSELRGNGLGGAWLASSYSNAYDQVELANTVVVDNDGPGVYVGTPMKGACSLTNVTVAGNDDCGVSSSGGQWAANNSVIAYNAGSAVDFRDGATVALTCSDIYGNLGGDWTDMIADQQGINGNASVDPLFCDALAGDYHLHQNSPLDAANNAGCGRIGCFGYACPPAPMALFKPYLNDVAADQGGHLLVSWPRHPRDSHEAAAVTGYELQRLGAAWQTVATLAAAAADSYGVIIATPDIATAGQPLPWAHYRIRAVTADSLVFFESLPDSGYSIDDLPPPKPDAVLVDAPEYRYIVWTAPEVEDLASACVFRGDVAGFEPTTPVACPGEGLFTESHLAWYFYRIRFADTHGNLSEFSDELHGQFPTDVSNALPAVLRLYPCRPNPFNPRTTISYDLPEAGSLRLVVFDLAGRLVRTLVDGNLPAGSHEVAWDGRDATGRAVGSGGYLARLEFAGKVETVRMGLVR